MYKFLFIISLFAAFASASDCIIHDVLFAGAFDESTEKYFMNLAKEPCSSVFARETTLVDYLVDDGFPFAKVSHDIDSSSGKLVVTLDRGNAWVWASSENVEKSKTHRNVFAMLSGLESGSAVRISDVSRAEQKLINSGYFESTAEPKLYRDSLRNRLVPVFSMRDLQVNSFEGFLTYASGEDGGWVGSLNLVLYNMRGTARDLSLSGETGDYGRSLTLYYKEPWLLGTDWNGIVRGNLEEDSTYKSALLEGGVSRNIGFYFEFVVLGGIGDDKWTYTLETHFKNEDRLQLPRRGGYLNGTFQVIKDRTDSSSEVSVSLYANGMRLTPITENWILQTSFFAGTLLPANKDFELDELYSLGGMDNLKGYRPDFFHTRAYGITEADLQLRALAGNSFHLFFEPALHRARLPEHGWVDTYSYGLGITQYRGSWSLSLYYALHRGEAPLDGLLHFGVRTLF